MLSYSAGRAADAVADLDQAIGLADDPWLRLNRAIALQDLGEHHRAVADLDIAIAALGEHPTCSTAAAQPTALGEIG